MIQKADKKWDVPKQKKKIWINTCNELLLYVIQNAIPISLNQKRINIREEIFLQLYVDISFSTLIKKVELTKLLLMYISSWDKRNIQVVLQGTWVCHHYNNLVQSLNFRRLTKVLTCRFHHLRFYKAMNHNWFC